MSETAKILLIGGQARKVVSDNTTLQDVESHFIDEYGKDKERQMRYSLRELPVHPYL